jgi:tetratricopeptide (TPR) repeat protein
MVADGARMNQAIKTVHSRFNPSKMPAELLEQTFVQREQLAQRLVSLFEASAEGQSKHHVLLVGPRGIGKSHLVALLYHRLSRSEAAQSKLEIAWLAEDEWGITSFLDLLVGVLEALSVNTKELATLSHFNAEKRATELLSERVLGKTLLLIVENLDSVLRNLGDAGQKKWRALIQNTGYWTILATAPALSEEIQVQVSPFYGFFEIQHLRGLTDEEGITMLRQLAEAQGKTELVQVLDSPAGRARVRALQHLAQGNHRVLIIFYDFLDEEVREDLLNLLWKTIDALTPYYQSLMKDLSPQQRKLVDFLCRHKIPAAVKTIASECLTSHQTAASQLKQLLEARYVRVERHGRESYYELNEPLLRICVEAKSHSSEPLPMLVELLRYWFSRRELEGKIQSAAQHWGRSYFEAALHKYEEGEGHTHLSLLVRDSCRRLSAAIADGSSETVKYAAEELAELAERDEDWSHYCRALVSLGDSARALARINGELELKPKDKQVLKTLAKVYLSCKQPKEALDAINSALASDCHDAYSWAIKGEVLEALDENDAALVAFNEAKRLNPVYPEYRLSLGRVMLSLNKPKESVKLLRSLVKKWAAPTAELLVNYGIALALSGKANEAVSIFEEACQQFPKDPETWLNLASCRFSLGQSEGAVAAINRIGALPRKDTELAWRVCWLQFELGRYQEASETLPVDAVAHQIYHELVDNLGQQLAEDQITAHLFNIRSRVSSPAWTSAVRGGLWEFLSHLASKLNDASAGVLKALNQVLREFSASEPEFVTIEKFVNVMSRYRESRDQRVLLELPLEQRTLLEGERM